MTVEFRERLAQGERWSRREWAEARLANRFARRVPAAVNQGIARASADADLYINLSGGSWFWRDEYARIPRSAFIDSDPAFTQLAIAKAEPWYVDFFTRFDRLFTFGANIGTPASAIPVGDFHWHKTWQPITLDDWRRRPLWEKIVVPFIWILERQQ